MFADLNWREVEDLLLSYEQRLLDPAIRRDRSAVSALLADDFREFGSSGRVLDRAAILDLLTGEPISDQPIATLSEFTLTLISADAALVTYRAASPGRSTLRSSLWISRGGKWLLLFHQGTMTGS